MAGTKEPDVSVVVCSLGTARLDLTLQSLQTAADSAAAKLEVIVVWESADRPPEPPDGARFLETFPGGLGNARNRGSAEARSSIVAFVDDDEVVDEGWAKGLIAAFGRAPSPDGLFGAVAPLDEDGLAYCRFDGTDDRVFRGAGTPPWHVGTGGNMAFRRDVLFEFGGFDPTFGRGAEAMAADETELVLRLLRCGKTLVWTPDMRVYHPTKSESERVASRMVYGRSMGRALRRHRRGPTAARYVVQLAHVAGGAVAGRDIVRLREAGVQLRGFAAGVLTPRTWLSPRRVLELAPPGIRRRLDGVRIEPLPAPDRPRPHLLYRVGSERILHAYGSPVAGLRRALEDRERIRSESGLDGIPQVDAIEPGLDSLWVLEGRLPGRHPRRPARAWFDRVGEWAVALAGPPGPQLRTTDDWGANTEAALRVCPQGLRADLSRAHELVGELAAVRVHGDLSRKNVLVDGERVGAVDWEDCALHGVPGRDLAFLAVGARGAAPDANVIRRLVQDQDPPFGRLLEFLARVGVAHDVIRPVLLTILAGWAADEHRRLADLGATERSRTYLALLTRCGAVLTSRR